MNENKNSKSEQNLNSGQYDVFKIQNADSWVVQSSSPDETKKDNHDPQNNSIKPALDKQPAFETKAHDEPYEGHRSIRKDRLLLVSAIVLIFILIALIIFVLVVKNRKARTASDQQNGQEFVETNQVEITPAFDPDAAYEPILSMYKRNLANNWSECDNLNDTDALDPDNAKGARSVPNDKKLAYAFMDLNGDSIEELLISSDGGFEQGYISTIYSTQNGEFFSLDGRSFPFILCEDGRILGSGEAPNDGFGWEFSILYRFGSNVCKDLIADEVICTQFLLSDQNLTYYYYGRNITAFSEKGGLYLHDYINRIDVSQLQEISKDEWFAHKDRLPEQGKRIDYTTF